MQETVKPVQETIQPVRETVDTTVVKPVVDPVKESVDPVVKPVQQTVGPVIGPVKETRNPVIDPVIKPVRDTVVPAPGSPTTAAGPLTPQIPSHTLKPGGGAPLASGPMSAPPPVSGAMPAAGTSFAAPVAAALGAPRAADGGLAAIGLPPSGREPAAAAANASLAWERPATPLDVASKESVSKTWGLSGPAAVASSGLGSLMALTAAAHDLFWAEMLGRLLSSGALPEGLSVASGGSASHGGSAPLPLSPAAPSSAASSSGLASGPGVGGGALAALAILLGLSPFGGKLVRFSREFLRPNSALVVAIERPG